MATETSSVGAVANVQSLRSPELLHICEAGKLDAYLEDGQWYVDIEDLLALVNARDALDRTMGMNGFVCALFAGGLCGPSERQRFNALFRLPEVGMVYAIESANFPGVLKIGKTSTPMRVRLSSINCAIPVNPFYEVDKFKSFDIKTSEREAHAHFRAQHEVKELFRLTHDEMRAYFTLQKQGFKKEALRRALTVRANRAKADFFSAWRQEAADELATKLLRNELDTCMGARLEDVPSLIKKLPGTMRLPTRAKLAAHFEELVAASQQCVGKKRRRESTDTGHELVELEARRKLIRDVMNDYVQMEERVKSDVAREEFSKLFLSIARQAAVVGNKHCS